MVNTRMAVLLTCACMAALAADFSPDRYGIGATLVQSDSTSAIEVAHCFRNGPADLAGLRAGDRLLKLDDHSVRGWPSKQVIDYLIRDEPAPLRMTVLRGENELSFHLVRMKLSDIAAGENRRIERDPRTNGYRFVPLNEKPALSSGDIVPLDSLYHDGCRISPIAAEDTTTVVYFWASWCGPCKVLMDRIENLPRNVRLVAVNVDSSCATFAAALARRDPPGADRWAGGVYGPLCQSLGVYRRGIPTAVLLGPKGNLVRMETGVESILAMVQYEPPSYLLPKFWLSAEGCDIPADVLISVAYAQSHWGHWGFPDESGNCGIMGLRYEAGSTVDEAVRLIVGSTREQVIRDLDVNILAGAALLARAFVAVHGDSSRAERMLVLDNWREVLPRFTRYSDPSVNDLVFEQFAACARGRGFGR